MKYGWKKLQDMAYDHSGARYAKKHKKRQKRADKASAKKLCRNPDLWWEGYTPGVSLGWDRRRAWCGRFWTWSKRKIEKLRLGHKNGASYILAQIPKKRNYVTEKCARNLRGHYEWERSRSLTRRKVRTKKPVDYEAFLRKVVLHPRAFNAFNGYIRLNHQWRFSIPVGVETSTMRYYNYDTYEYETHIVHRLKEITVTRNVRQLGSSSDIPNFLKDLGAARAAPVMVKLKKPILVPTIKWVKGVAVESVEVVSEYRNPDYHPAWYGSLMEFYSHYSDPREWDSLPLTWTYSNRRKKRRH